MNVNTNTFHIDLSCVVLIHNNAGLRMRTYEGKVTKRIRKANQKFHEFVPVLCKHDENFHFHRGLTSSPAHVNMPVLIKIHILLRLIGQEPMITCSVS